MRTTYDVEWARDDGERLLCIGLTPRVLTARIMGAIANSGPITIHSVTASPRADAWPHEGNCYCSACMEYFIRVVCRRNAQAIPTREGGDVKQAPFMGSAVAKGHAPVTDLSSPASRED